MWHRVGTITVTKGSKTVAGAGGTSWVENIRVGDALQGPDGRYYEVTNVASDTELSIEPAYMGNTASGQWYQILSILGQQKRLADRAAELVGAVGLLPGRMSAAEDAMLVKSANLSDLQNVKQSQINLGVIRTSTGEVFNTDNCTTHTNANGTCIRHPDGTQFCWGAEQFGDNRAWAVMGSTSLYTNLLLGRSYPQNFAASPSVKIRIRSNVNGVMIANSHNASPAINSQSAKPDVLAVSANTSAVVSIAYDYEAKGRWK